MCLRCGEMVNHLPRNEQHMRYTSIFMNGLTELNNFFPLLPQESYRRDSYAPIAQVSSYHPFCNDFSFRGIMHVIKCFGKFDCYRNASNSLMIGTSYIVESSI